MENVVILKKDGSKEQFRAEKIKKAISKSAQRVLINFTEEDLNAVVDTVIKSITKKNISEVTIAQMHHFVEGSLEEHFPAVAKSYRDYRNYKQDFVHMLDEVYMPKRRNISKVAFSLRIEMVNSPVFSIISAVRFCLFMVIDTRSGVSVCCEKVLMIQPLSLLPSLAVTR